MNIIHRIWALLLVTLLFTACSSDKNDTQQDNSSQEEITQEQASAYESDVVLEQDDIVAVIQTSKGDIKLQLYTDEAPLTTTNFIVHALDDYYKDTIFHRVIDDFMIQWGDPLGNGMGGESIYGGPFEDEFFDKIENLPGTISMANSGVNTNGSQFFINEANNSFLNGKHAVFGKVYEGMDIVDTITQVPLNGEKPATDVVIKDIVIYQYVNGNLVDYTVENTQEYIQQAQEKHEELKQATITAQLEQRQAKIQQDVARVAQSGDVVEFKYEFSLDDGTIIDSTLEEEFGGQVQIDGQNPLPGLNEVLKGMKIGDEKTGTLSPEQAYGPETIEVPREQMKDIEDAGFTLEVGVKIPVQGGEIEILWVDENNVVIKNPHPAAGKNLNYTVKVIYFVN